MKRHLFYLFLGLFAAVSLNDFNHEWLFPIALTTLALIDLRIFSLLLRWKLWMFLILLVLVPVLLVGNKDALCLGVPFNSSMLQLNLLMVQRSLLVMLTVKMFTNHLSMGAISRGFTRLRLYQFDQVFRLATDLMPQVREMVTQTLQEINWKQLLCRRRGVLQPVSRLMARIILHASKLDAQSSETS